MALTGSDLAYKQGRFGIARFGASRFNYFIPNVVITVGGTDRTSKVLRAESLRVTLNRNEEADTAEFTIGRNPGFTPTAGQEVVIGLGTAVNREFAGQIINVRHLRTNKTQYPRYHVSCTDWAKLFNRLTITANFSGQSASAIAASIVANYTAGFTARAVEAGLATIDEFICINEPPMTTMARLANQIGGAFFIDALQDVHLWGSLGPSSGFAPTNPVTLTDNLATLKAFSPEYDFSQIGTRAIVEGRSFPCPIAIPAGANLGGFGIPTDLHGGWIFNPVPGSNYARIGSLIVSYSYAIQVNGPPVVVLNAALSPGDTSAEIVPAAFTGAGWFHDGNGNYFATRGNLHGPPDFLTGIPATGYGSVPLVIAAGTPVFQTHHLEAVAAITADGAVPSDIEAGEAVVVRVQVDDSAAQTAIAAIEGGDGIHVRTVTDDTLTYIGCLARGEAELDVFSDALLRATWVTYDMNAKPGTRQVINLASPDALSAQLTVDTVVLEFPISNYPPKRTCEGSTVKLATILDHIGAT